MAQDPGFLFYPGDYLRDTQCLSEKSQTAYDRIMCEHMRNICISPKRLNFFTKKLNEEETFELMSVLRETPDGFQIAWVSDSILKYNKFRASRANNRKGKSKEQVNNTSQTSEQHMDIEYDIDIENDKDTVFGKSENLSPDTELPQNILETCELNQFTFTQNKNTEFIQAQWKIFLTERIHDPPIKRLSFQELSDYTSYFINWVRTKKPDNGRNSKSTGAAGKPGTSEARTKTAREW